MRHIKRESLVIFLGLALLLACSGDTGDDDKATDKAEKLVRESTEKAKKKPKKSSKVFGGSVNKDEVVLGAGPEDTVEVGGEKIVVSKIIERFDDGSPKKFYVYENGQIKMMLDYYEPNVKREMVEYNGHTKATGASAEWYRNGQKKTEGHFDDGKRHGTFISWDEEGNKLEEVNYQNDLRHGKLRKWYENGQLELEAEYQNGDQYGEETIWYENGNKEQVAYYKDGYLDDKKTFWREDGSKQHECEYLEGMKHGAEIFFNEEGDTISVETYFEDTKQ